MTVKVSKTTEDLRIVVLEREVRILKEQRHADSEREWDNHLTLNALMCYMGVECVTKPLSKKVVKKGL